MFYTYTAKYTKIKSGYMGQLVEGSVVVTERKNHSIYTNCKKTIPIKRHKVFDRMKADDLC
jgi:hypothetical protein